MAFFRIFVSLLALCQALLAGRPFPQRLLQSIRSDPKLLQFYRSSFDQLEYIFNDNSEAASVLKNFYLTFTSAKRNNVKGPKGVGQKVGQNNLKKESSAVVGKTMAAATSSDTFYGRKTLIISGSNGQFVRNPADGQRDSMRVYNIGEIMIEGVVAFVEIQASLLRNGNYYLDAKINEHNDGMVISDEGLYIDSKTVSRKVLMYDKKFGFGVAEVYVVLISSDAVDFKMYTIASGLGFQTTKIISSVIIEIKHVQIKRDSQMTIEQATLTSTSDCSFEEKCKVVNLGSIKVNGDLMSKLVQAKAVAGVDFEKKAAYVSQLYEQKESSTSK